MRKILSLQGVQLLAESLKECIKAFFQPALYLLESFCRPSSGSTQSSTTTSVVKSESSQEVVKMVTQTGPLWHTVLSYGRVDCVDEHNRDRAGGDSDTATFRHEGHDNQPKIPRRPTHGKKKTAI